MNPQLRPKQNQKHTFENDEPGGDWGGERRVIIWGSSGEGGGGGVGGWGRGVPTCCMAANNFAARRCVLDVEENPVISLQIVVYKTRWGAYAAGENIQEALEDAEWRCPVCRDICNCSGEEDEREKKGGRGCVGVGNVSVFSSFFFHIVPNGFPTRSAPAPAVKRTAWNRSMHFGRVPLSLTRTIADARRLVVVCNPTTNEPRRKPFRFYKKNTNGARRRRRRELAAPSAPYAAAPTVCDPSATCSPPSSSRTRRSPSAGSPWRTTSSPPGSSPTQTLRPFCSCPSRSASSSKDAKRASPPTEAQEEEEEREEPRRLSRRGRGRRRAALASRAPPRFGRTSRAGCAACSPRG